MNLRGGIALIKKSIFSFTAARGFFWTLALSWMMMPLIYMFVWGAIAGDASVGDFTKIDFNNYYMVLIVVNQLTYPVSHWTVGDNIFSGQFSSWLLRPLPPIYEAIASDVAVKVICLPFVCAFVLVLITIFGFSIPINLEGFLIFVFTIILAQMLRFMLAYALSLTALMKVKIDALLNINDAMVLIFAGQLIPTILLPDFIKKISFVLPYRYMLGFPIELLLGKLDNQGILFGIGVQLVWLVIVIGLYSVIWRKGIKHYTSIGG